MISPSSTQRLANRAQRRAARAMYTRCGIPGCHRHIDDCELHHLVWWEHGGHTDLENLFPVCKHHHDLIHSRQWTVTMGPDRSIIIHLPDGTTMTADELARATATNLHGEFATVVATADLLALLRG